MADVRKNTIINTPRGSTPGRKAHPAELTARRAAASKHWVFEDLLAWKVYPDRVVLIDLDGRKVEIPLAELNASLEEAV